MRTTEERIAAMHERAKEINRQKRTHRVRILQTVSIAACFAVVILMAVFMPNSASLAIPPGSTSNTSLSDMHASIFSENGAMSYVVIAIVAFLLGAAVTVFCFRLKKWQDQKNGQDGESNEEE